MVIKIPEKEFIKLSPSDKKYYLDNLIEKKQSLKAYEFKYLSPSQRVEYLDIRVKISEWLHVFEFQATTEKQKKQYIFRKRFLRNGEFIKLSDKLKKFYIEQAAYTQLQLSDEEFESLTPKMKTHYCNFMFEYPLDLDLNKASYLSNKNQKKLVEKMIERNKAFTKLEYDMISKSLQKYYDDCVKKSHLTEIRKVVRDTLKDLI